MRRIDADAIMLPDKYAHVQDAYQAGYNDAIDECQKSIDDTATNDNESEWVKGADMKPYKNRKYTSCFKYCKACRNEAYWDTDYGQQLFPHCPYCGAKMVNGGF